jgi:hypothetical protein
MLGLFKRAAPAADACELGRTVVALPLRSGCAAPPGCAVVIVDAGGATRRTAGPKHATKRIEPRDGELAYACHPGPYTIDILPFAQAPEIGLRTRFGVDADPQAPQQRFDLYLASEVSGRLELAALATSVEDAVQRELAHGGLELPPCATIEEWNAFRLGLNQLLYLRFGLTVDDCVPVDLGAARDYAAILSARAAQADAAHPSDLAAAPVVEPTFEPDLVDAKALRRLFLELPCLMCGLRLAALPANPAQFRQQQALLQRLDLLSVAAGAMPALGLAAPGQPLGPQDKLRRARHSRRATASLDEAWALLARMKGAPPELLATLYDEAERIVANLETDCAARRVTQPDDGEGAW